MREGSGTKIVVVGSINLDRVATVARLPAPGETVLGEQFATHHGGKGANQAVAAARLGGHVALVGRLGVDAAAAELREGLERAGVDTRHVREVAGVSGTAIVLVEAAGANSIVVIPGANAALQPGDLGAAEGLFADAGIILAQLEIPLATVEELGRISARLGVPFVLDPVPARPLGAELLRTVTWLTPNESECRTLLDALGAPDTANDLARAERDPHSEELRLELWERAARTLLDAGARNVVLKLGAEGCFLAGADVAPTFVPPFRVEAVDTTAAGDAFNAGFAFGLAERGLDPVAAARFGSAVAALSVTRSGAQGSMPGLAEVEELMERQP